MIISKDCYKGKGDFITFVKEVHKVTSAEAIRRAEQILSEVKPQKLNQTHLGASACR
jgi:hypothetical protein